MDFITPAERTRTPLLARIKTLLMRFTMGEPDFYDDEFFPEDKKHLQPFETELEERRHFDNKQRARDIRGS